MNATESEQAAALFLGLKPTSTPEQMAALHRAISSYPFESARDAIEHACTHERYAADAVVRIVGTLESRHGPPPERTPADATDTMRASWRAQESKVKRERREDFWTLLQAALSDFERLKHIANEVLAGQEPSVGAAMGRRGFLVHRGWRGLTARRLRVASGSERDCGDQRW